MISAALAALLASAVQAGPALDALRAEVPETELPQPSPAARQARYCALGAGAESEGVLALPLFAVEAADVRARSADGVPVSAGPSVAPAAVAKAAALLDGMLAESSRGLKARLARARVFVVVIPREKKLTDLPQFASLRGRRLSDGRVWDDIRGVGFVWQDDGSAAAAVGEENLLADAFPDGYPKGFLVAHEFAHAVHEFGLDGAAQDAISASYRRRKAAGLPFPSAYASTTRYEYFAVSSSALFDVRLANEREWAWVAREDKEIARSATSAFGAPRPLRP